jgi:hypothetical protein
MQGQTEQDRLAALEAEYNFQRRTLHTIRLVAEAAPPEQAQVALHAVGALAEEALGEAEPEDHSAKPGAHHSILAGGQPGGLIVRGSTARPPSQH